MSQRLLLKGKEDIYHGLTIETEKNKINPEEAKMVLGDSIAEWIHKNVHGVWFKVLSEDSFWVPILVEHGFDFHHAQSGYVMMTKWLPTNKSPSLPMYPFTTVGVGGVVMNSKGQFLLIKEKKGFYLGWKFPGGLADPNEEIYEVAKREILEETGVETEFETLITMRHTTKISSYKNVGDMYFVCAMKPKDENNIEPKPCPREVSACQWMTQEEIEKLSTKEFHHYNRTILDAYLHWKSSGKKGFYMTKIELPEFRRKWSVYTID
uniref:Nudix hydrolase domain-containing protein n=1 Tax=Panagrolaimus sp. JU765 TaxID=591449 RepID=A0AC34QA83_9BILA